MARRELARMGRFLQFIRKALAKPLAGDREIGYAHAWMVRAFALVLVLSGIASLTYQVTWVRLLGLSIGATSSAVSTVVAAFFLGLSLGSFAVARYAHRFKDALLVYLVLEACIGLFGLLLLPALLNLDQLVALFPGIGTSLLLKFLLTVSLLLLPTLCMGATFPVMARVMVASDATLGSKLSDLYGFNTFGAVLGAALTGFLFIPQVGLDGAIYIAVGLNLLVALLAASMRLSMRPIVLGEPRSVEKQKLGSRQLKALAVLCVTGFVAIAVEVAWTKYLVMYVGTTIYGFSAIVSAILLGVALGSWSVRSKLDSFRRPARALALGLCLLGAALLLVRSGLGVIGESEIWLAELGASSPVVIHLFRYMLVFLLLLPATWLFGALFPLSLRLFCTGNRNLSGQVGVAYALNTLLGIAGSLLAGFVWLPTLGTPHLLLWTAVVVWLLPCIFYKELADGQRLGLSLALLLGVAGARWLPAPEHAKLLASVRLDLTLDPRPQHTVFLREGKTGVVSVDTANGNDFKLYNNGLNESRIDQRDPYNALLMESLLGLFPYLLQPEPRSAFVVGLGGGATMRALQYTAIESLRVVELEPLMRDAVLAVLGASHSGLDDPRLRLTFNDARNTLLVEQTRYDIIVSQPSHPWRSGAANLFTQEFFQIARSRLAPRGIYGQWLALFRMDQATLRSIMQAFLATFPHAMTLANTETGDVLFFGSLVPLKLRPELVYARAAEPQVERLLGRRGIKDPVQLLRLFALSRSEMLQVAGDAPLATDTNLLPEVRLAGLLTNPTGEAAPVPALRRGGRFDILPYLEPSVQSQWLQQLVLGLHSSGDRKTAQRAWAQLAQIDPKGAANLRRLLLPRRRR